MSWPTFWTEETGDIELSLRRFTFGVYHPSVEGDGYHDDRPDHIGCPAMPWTDVRGVDGKQYQQGHDASVHLDGRLPERRSDEGFLTAIAPEEYTLDERWPTTCTQCGGHLPNSTVWQVNQEPIYRRPDTDEEWTQKQLSAGAMFDGHWHREKGPDGIALVVVLPSPGVERIDARPHFWHVDGPSRNQGVPGPGWTRTGDPKSAPPTITAAPSILTGDYHGFLQNGTLTDDLDGRA